MGWRTLYLEEGSEMSLYLDNLKVKRGANDFLFPLSDLNIVVVDNQKCLVSLSLLNALARNNVTLVGCDLSHLPESILLPISGYYENCRSLQNQISWDKNITAILWKEIVKAKISNQLFVLNKFDKDEYSRETIKRFIEEVEPNDAGNREGLAAKMYFNSLFGKSFSRQKECVINAGLNYGYSLFRSLISKVIVAKGLHPNLGIFHRGMSNYFNLSDDLIEPFRPIIDSYVYENLSDVQIFKREHRIEMLKLLNGKIIFNGTKQTITHVIEGIVDSINETYKTGAICFKGFEPVLYDL